jgi:hypothetical protein
MSISSKDDIFQKDVIFLQLSQKTSSVPDPILTIFPTPVKWSRQ